MKLVMKRVLIIVLVIMAAMVCISLTFQQNSSAYADDKIYKIPDEIGGSVEFTIDEYEENWIDVTYHTETTTWHNVTLEVLECSNDFSGIDTSLDHSGWSRGYGLEVNQDKRSDTVFSDSFEPRNEEYDNSLTFSAPGEGSVKLRVTVTPVHCAGNFIMTLDKTTYKATDASLPKPKSVTFCGSTLKEGVDYKYDSSYGTVTVEGLGTYDCDNGEVPESVWDKFGYMAVWCQMDWYEIVKVNSPMTVKGKTAGIKYSAVKKKNQTLKVSKVLTIKKKQGTVTYKKMKGDKKITINSTSGKVTVKKGIKKGKYKVTVNVSDKGNTYYNAKTVKATFTIQVK